MRVGVCVCRCVCGNVREDGSFDDEGVWLRHTPYGFATTMTTTTTTTTTIRSHNGSQPGWCVCPGAITERPRCLLYGLGIVRLTLWPASSASCPRPASGASSTSSFEPLHSATLGASQTKESTHRPQQIPLARRDGVGPLKSNAVERSQTQSMPALTLIPPRPDCWTETAKRLLIASHPHSPASDFHRPNAPTPCTTALCNDPRTCAPHGANGLDAPGTQSVCHSTPPEHR